MTVGQTNDLCMNQEMVDCRANAGNQSTNDVDLTCFLENYPGACEGLGLTEEGSCTW